MLWPTGRYILEHFRRCRHPQNLSTCWIRTIIFQYRNQEAQTNLKLYKLTLHLNSAHNAREFGQTSFKQGSLNVILPTHFYYLKSEISDVFTFKWLHRIWKKSLSPSYVFFFDDRVNIRESQKRNSHQIFIWKDLRIPLSLTRWPAETV